MYYTGLQSEGDRERCPRQDKDPWPGWCHITVPLPSGSFLGEAMDLHTDKSSDLTPSCVSPIANLKRFALP